MRGGEHLESIICGGIIIAKDRQSRSVANIEAQGELVLARLCDGPRTESGPKQMRFKLIIEGRYVIRIDCCDPFTQVIRIILVIWTMITPVVPLQVGGDTETLANVAKIRVDSLRPPDEVHAQAKVGIANKIVLRPEVNPRPNVFLI